MCRRVEEANGIYIVSGINFHQFKSNAEMSNEKADDSGKYVYGAEEEDEEK